MLAEYEELLTISEFKNNEYTLLMNQEYLRERGVDDDQLDEVLDSMLVLIQDKISEDRRLTPIALKTPIPPPNKNSNFVFSVSLFTNNEGDYKTQTSFGANVQENLPLKSALYYILKVIRGLRSEAQ